MTHGNTDAGLEPLLVQRRRSVRNCPRRHISGLFAGPAFALFLLSAQSWLLAAGVQVHAESETLDARHPALYYDADLVLTVRNALARAEQEQYQEAASLFQRAIDQSLTHHSPLVKGDHGWVTIARRVEQLILEHDEQLLVRYQALVEGRVRELMSRASGPHEEAALSEVVSRYFLSSRGDEAAYRLGVIHLDRYAFVRARTLLKKALNHPTRRIPRSDIKRRLAAVAAFKGERDAVAAYRREFSAAHESESAFFDRLQAIAEGASDRRPVTVSDWPMHLGTPQRNGRQLPLTGDGFKNTTPWTKLWHTGRDFSGIGTSNSGIRQYAPSVSLTRGEILRRWRQFGWTPNRRLSFADGLVLFKTHHYVNPEWPRQHSVPALVALDVDSGEMRWAVPGEPSAWITERSSERDMVRLHRADRPSSTEELLLFGDRISQEKSIFDGTVYSIAKNEWHAGSGGHLGSERTRTRPFSHFGPNSLVAIELKTGRRLWQIDGDGGKPSKDFRFVAAPLKKGNTLYAPVEQDGGLYLMAIDAAPRAFDAASEDRVLWKAYLCSIEKSGSREWSPVGMTIVDRGVFVGTGRGLVFAVDGGNGAIRWATSYEQCGEIPRQRRAFAGVDHLRGWMEDIVLPWGDALVVLPSDTRRLLLIDQESGRLLDGTLDLRRYDDLDHLIGVTEHGLVAAGTGSVRHFEVNREKSRQLWVRRLGPQTGRGTIAGDMILIPVEDRIYQLRLEDGKIGSSVQSAWRPGDGTAREPLGNLYSNGESLLVAGMGEVYALLDGRSRLAQLQDRMAETGPTAELVKERASILRAMEDWDAAAEELRRALQTTRNGAARQGLEATLLDVLTEHIRRGSERPDRLYAKAALLARDTQQRAELAWATAANYESRGRCSSALEYYLRMAAWGRGTVVDADHSPRLDRQSVRSLALERIHAFIERNPDAAAKLEETADRVVGQVQREEGTVTYLVDFGLALANTSAGRRAVLTGAEHLVRQQRIEEAEAVLRELASAETEIARLTGQVALARLYQSVGWHRLAVEQWRQIECRADCDVEVKWGSNGSRTIGELYRESRRVLDDSVCEPGPVLRDDAEWRKLWHASEFPGTGHLLNPGLNNASDHLHEMVLLPKRGESKLVSRGTDAAAQWKLRFPESAIVNRQMGLTAGNVWVLQDYYLADTNGRMLRDGHIGIGISQERIMGYGLVRRDAEKGQFVRPLWEIAHNGRLVHERAEPVQLPRARRGIAPYAVGSGVVALALKDDATAAYVLRVFCARTGHLSWQRGFGDRPIKGVIVCGAYVAAVDRSDRVEVHDRRTGASVGRFRIRNRGAARPVLMLDGALVYADEDDRVKRVSLPGGEQQWSFDAGGRVRVMHAMPQGKVVIVTGNPTGVLVANLCTADRTWVVDDEVVSQVFPRGIEDAALAADGSLIVTGHDAAGVPRLVRINPGQGTRTGDLAVNEPIGVAPAMRAQQNGIRADWFVRAGDVIPTVHLVGERREVEVRFVRWESGELVEQLRLEGPQDGRFGGVNGPIVVAGRMILVPGSGGLEAYGQEEVQE